MILQLFMSGSEAYFIDPKSVSSAFQEFLYPLNVFKKILKGFLKLLRHVCDELRRRHKIVAKAVKNSKIGLRGYDTWFDSRLMPFADEIGSGCREYGQQAERAALLSLK